jgi:hypothetical protein
MNELRAANEKRKRKRAATQSFIASGGVLTGAEGQQLAQEAERLVSEETMPRKRAPPRCSNCHQVGHIRTGCPNR